MRMPQQFKAAAFVAAFVAVGVGWFMPIKAADEPAKTAQEKGADPDAPQADGPPSFLTVAPSRLKETITLRGLAAAGRARNLVCRLTGETVVAALVDEGTHVKPGDLVCELDASALKDQLTNQSITAKSAQASFMNAQLTREIAEIAVPEYRYGTLVTEKAVLEGQKKLHDSMIERHRDNLDRMLAAQKRARDAVKQGLAKPTPAEILAEISIDAYVMSAFLECQKDRFEVEQNGVKKEILEKYQAPMKLKELSAAIEKARAEELAKKATWELENSKERRLTRLIESCRMVAPIEGIVVHAAAPGGIGARTIESGDKVHDRQTIATVADLTTAPLQIQVKVSRDQAERLRAGQIAQAKFQGLGAARFPGKVKSVGNIPDPAGKPDETKPPLFSVVIELDKNPPAIHPGQDAEVAVVSVRDNVVVIPKNPVVTQVERKNSEKSPQGQTVTNLFSTQVTSTYQVAVKGPSGNLVWRQVALGLVGATAVEIKSGLAVGDQLLLNPRDDAGYAIQEEKCMFEYEAMPAPAKPAAAK